jgi:hypothetical protein
MKITIRGYSGFSCAPFYGLAGLYNLYYTLGPSSNPVLERRAERSKKAVGHLYLDQGKKHNTLSIMNTGRKVGMGHNNVMLK